MLHTIIASIIIFLGTSSASTDQGPVVSSYTSSSTNRRCSPVYSPGGDYAMGNSVSHSITTTIPLASAPCTVRGVGCHTGWTQTGGDNRGGGAYAIGNSLSQSITTTIPLASAPCTVRGAGCHKGRKQAGGVATTAMYNFVCSFPEWCSNVDYAPGSIHSDLAWTKEAVACSVSTSVCQ
jgi:hypothetical protein